MSNLKTSFAVGSKYEAFYTGGKIQVSSDGLYMFCGCGNKVNILEISTGKVHQTVGEEEDEEITSFCLTPNDEYVILATQNLLLRQWKWKEKVLVRTWKAIHFAPVVSMAFDPTSTLLATGSADSTIKLWDIEKQYCTHNLRGHQGIISVVAFHPDISRLLLYSAGEDYKIRAWNLQNSTCIAEISAHYSMVTCICFSLDGANAYTSGRDAVVSILDTTTHKVKKTIPVFEVVESVVLLPDTSDYPAINVDSGSTHFITAGNKGVLRLWNSDTGKCVYTTDPVHSKCDIKEVSTSESEQKKEADDSHNIVQMVHNKEKNNVTVVTYDQNISILSVEKLRLLKQFAGNNDDILDVKYFSDNKFAIVATNSMHIKVFELSNWDCEIVYGHTDTVLCIDVVPKSDMFISGSKDNTVRLWKINPVLKQVSCLAIGQGHTNAVGAIAMSRVKPKFFVSGSEDCTLKVWTMPEIDSKVTMEMHATVTEKAHDKTISSVAVAPNDKFIASGSMDKTAKLWKAGDLSLIGVMRGHKRGIWCVQFSPVDQILASSSGDGAVKLWSLFDFSCVRTFDGHDCAVLKVAFITRGMQLLSSGTDGLIKLWTIKNNECVKTLDAHEDKVWALAVGDESEFITGGADSNLVTWKDVTETEQVEARQKQEEFILQEQTLSNLIQQKKYLKAIGLAITLEQPFRLLNILKEILSEEDGDTKLFETLGKLRMDQIDSLLRFAVQWNTNSRHCHEAQVVLSSVLKLYPPSKLKELANLKSSVEGLLPYTERHYNRMSRLVQQSMFLEYTWQCMKGIASDQPEMESEVTYPTDSMVIETLENESEESSSESELEYDEVNKNVPKLVKKATPGKEKNTLDNTTRIEDSETESSEEDSDDENDTNISHKCVVNQKQTNKLTIEESDSEDSDSESDDEHSDSEITFKKTITEKHTSSKKAQFRGTAEKSVESFTMKDLGVDSDQTETGQSDKNVNSSKKAKKAQNQKRGVTTKGDTSINRPNTRKDQGHLSEKSQNKQSGGSKILQKRKITDEFSVVKEKTPKVVGLDVFQDEKSSMQGVVEDFDDSKEGGKKRKSLKNMQKLNRKVSLKDKLKRPKRLGR